MHQGDDGPPEGPARAEFEDEVRRIEAEVRAVFDAYGAQAGEIPERLVLLARELERLLELKARRSRAARPVDADPDAEAPGRNGGRAAGGS